MSARFLRRLVGAMAIAGLALAASAARADQVVVFAAASLKTALDRIAASYEAQSGVRVFVSYAGSAQLARQIEQGAPADVFISASVAWMDYLGSAERIVPTSRFDLLGNRLVLIASGSGHATVDLAAAPDLEPLLGDGRLAMAMVEAVPAGIYGRQALASLGLWDQVASRLAQTDNVRAALALVASGEAPYGVVYATDARAEPRVQVVGRFPANSHDPIVYPAARVADSISDHADALLTALRGEAAQEIFESQGFTMPGEGGDG